MDVKHCDTPNSSTGVAWAGRSLAESGVSSNHEDLTVRRLHKRRGIPFGWEEDLGTELGFIEG